jgi:subtilisin family serine protease
VSGNDPNGNDVGLDPVQWNYFPDPSGSGTAATYYLAITLNGGTVPVGQDQFKVIISNDAFTPIGFTGANAGVGSGTVSGHAADPNAISVGAVDYHNTPAFGVSPPQIEPFSSSGPGQTLINATGQQLATPQSDGKVTLAAPDGNPTTLPSREGLNPFYGTSAATPAAAAIAALMLQEDAALTPAQISAMLAQSALAMANSNVSGAGLVQADAAVGLAQSARGGRRSRPSPNRRARATLASASP